MKMFITGAVLTMVASFLVVVEHNFYGNLLFIASNFCLFMCAIDIIQEFFRNVMNPPINPPGE